MAITAAQKLKQLAIFRVIQKRILEKSAKEHFSGIENVAKVLRGASVIDWEAYAARSGCRAMGYEPAFHYVLTGELEGYGLPDFDAAFYAARYPDAGALGPNRLLHYVTYGQKDGRYKTRAELEAPLPHVPNTQGRPVVFVVDHEASRTGAPILGWNIIEKLKARYFVVSIVFGGGDLMETFAAAADVAIACPKRPQDRRPVVDKLIETYRPRFAIVNSVECRAIGPDLAAHHVPYVTLVQEFGCFYGYDGLKEIYADAAALVFASKVIMDSSIENNPYVPPERCFLQPQGRSAIPPISAQEMRRKSASHRKDDIRAALRPPGQPRQFIVAGLGTVDMRKGVDLFVSAATHVARSRPDLAVRFVWIGRKSSAEEHARFLMYIEEQIARAGASNLSVLPPTADIDAVYEEIDALFLSSRLDPMPNVAIDAAMAGTPVICFENGTGFAEILQAHNDLKRLVVPYLDVGAAAEVIQGLAGDASATAAIGRSIRRVAETTFDMDAYVALVEDLGLKASARRHEATAG